MSILAASVPFWDALNIVILFAVGCCLIAGFICRCIYYRKLCKLNRIPNEKNVSGYAVARSLLDVNDMKNIPVRETGKLRQLMQANSYAPILKTIYLHPSLQNKKSVAAVGKATQCVSFGLQVKWKNKNMKIKQMMEFAFPYLPTLFVAITLTSFAIAVANVVGESVSYIAFLVLGIILLWYTVYYIFRIPVDKKANDLSMKMLKQSGFLNEKERAQMTRLMSLDQGCYWVNFILSLFLVVEIILQLVIYFLF